MKYLVTGAAGRAGANVVKRFVEAGLDVRAMVMPNDPLAAKLDPFSGVEVVEADLCDQASVDAACKGVTHVVHLAAQLPRGETPVDRYYDVNAFGTLRLLDGMLRMNGEIERFVLASTDGTYRPGNPPAVPLVEDLPQEPAEYYGTSKLLGEIILRNHAAQFDVPFAIVRFATIVHPETAADYFRLAFLRSFFDVAKRSGREFHAWQLFDDQPDVSTIFDTAVGDAGDATAVALTGPEGRPWSLHMLDVRDLVEGVYLALTEPAALGGAFNIAAPEPTSHDEGASVLSELYDVPKLTVQVPMTWALEMSIEAARNALGYRPQHDYRSMVEAGLEQGPSTTAGFVPVGL